MDREEGRDAGYRWRRERQGCSRSDETKQGTKSTGHWPAPIAQLVAAYDDTAKARRNERCSPAVREEEWIVLGFLGNLPEDKKRKRRKKKADGVLFE